MRVEREAFTKLLRCFYSAADLDHMVTQLNREEPTSKMLTPVLYILEKRRQLAHDVFQSATRSSSAKLVDIMARLYLLSEGKDQGCSSHEEATADRTKKPYACTRLSPVAVDESVDSADAIDFTLDLDGVKPLEDIEPTKTVGSTKAMKMAASSKITKAEISPTSLTLLRYPKAWPYVESCTQSLVRSDNLRVTIDKCTFSTRLALFLVLYQAVGRSSTIQTTSPTTGHCA